MGAIHPPATASPLKSKRVFCHCCTGFGSDLIPFSFFFRYAVIVMKKVGEVSDEVDAVLDGALSAAAAAAGGWDSDVALTPAAKKPRFRPSTPPPQSEGGDKAAACKKRVAPHSPPMPPLPPSLSMPPPSFALGKK